MTTVIQCLLSSLPMGPTDLPYLSYSIHTELCRPLGLWIFKLLRFKCRMSTLRRDGYEINYHEKPSHNMSKKKKRRKIRNKNIKSNLGDEHVLA